METSLLNIITKAMEQSRIDPQDMITHRAFFVPSKRSKKQCEICRLRNE